MNSENPSRPKRWRHGILGWLEKLHGIIVRKDSIETTGFAPVIRQFTASSEDADGQPITLSWEVENTTRLLLNDQDVTGQSTALVNPRSDTEYILHAFNELDNELGEKSSPILIRLNTTPPFINFFRTSTEIARGGQPVLLSWQVARATHLEIEGIGPVIGESLSVMPTEDMVYVLKATSHAGITTTAHVGIEVDKTPPVITRLEIEPRILTNIQPVRVVWETQGAEHVEIVGFGQYPPAGEVELRVQRDMALQFLAVSHYQIQSSETIEITTSKEPPLIRAFRPDRSVITDATPIILSWEVEDAFRLEIDGGVGDVTNLNSCKVHPSEDHVFTLTAWSYFGITAHASVALQIDRTPPKIAWFNSDKAFILADSNVELSWDVPGAHKVVLHPPGLNVNNRGSSSALVTKDTVFSLVAYNYFGYSSKSEQEVRILPIPLIQSLLIPTPSTEHIVRIEIDRLVLSDIPTYSIQLDTSLLNIPLAMVALKIESFTPPLEIRDPSWMDSFTNGFLNKFQSTVRELRQLVRKKIRGEEISTNSI